MAHAAERSDPPPARKREPGGGRKRKLDLLPTLGAQIEALLEVDNSSEQPLFRWTAKGTDTLAAELRGVGLNVSRRIVGEHLRTIGCHLPQGRNLPQGRGIDDVNRQFHHIAESVRSQHAAGGGVLFLGGSKVVMPHKQRYHEKYSHVGPSLDMWLDKYCSQGFDPTPSSGVIPNFYAYRAHNRRKLDEEAKRNPKQNTKKDIQQEVYAATKLPLKDLTTDRNAAIFTAMVLRHWWRSGMAATIGRQETILLLTHGASPDIAFPRIWKWAMDKLSRELGIIISVCRIPPSIWKFTDKSGALFSFVAQRDPKTPTREAHLIKGRLVFHDCKEMASIAAMFDFRRYPKYRKVSDRMLRAMNIRPDEPYADWNYSFVPGTRRRGE